MPRRLARCCLLAALCLPLGRPGAPRAALAGEVSWLARVNTPPAEAPAEEIGKLKPVLADDGGQPITTRAEWEAARKRLRERWLDFLGPMPHPRPPAAFEVLRTEQAGPIERQLVRYECEPGQLVEGYLLRPRGEGEGGKRPGLVALHQTTSRTIDEIAGLAGPAEMHIGPRLAGRGFVVFCPRCFLWQDAADYEEAVAGHRRRHPGSLGMAKMLYDCQRAVDLLAGLHEVDADAIGAVGHSLGAKETLYLAAFDERIKAAVASEGGLGFRSTNWDAPWYLGPAIHDSGFALNHHQLLALIAPRPFLVLAGETGPSAADGNRSWPLLEAAIPAWHLYGEPVRLGLFNHRQGHALPDSAFEHLAEWLQTYLEPSPPGR